MWWDKKVKEKIKPLLRKKNYKERKEREWREGRKLRKLRNQPKRPKVVEFFFKPLRIVYRDQWDLPLEEGNGEGSNALKIMPTEVSTDVHKFLPLPVPNVIFSYTGTDICESYEQCVEALRAMHREALSKNLPDIPYNFLVGRDGTIYEGRGWKRVPERCDRYPNIHGDSIEIAHIAKKGSRGMMTSVKINPSTMYDITLMTSRSRYWTNVVITPVISVM